ncbi:MAG: hypothetical protein P1P83_02670 [Bacteroidales bacterium]|nr:hypothetical protein [Bacteroidales bacterium]MDT8373217.1 hypothetical protein [Bacteroidales bacterium]
MSTSCQWVASPGAATSMIPFYSWMASPRGAVAVSLNAPIRG